jgi:CDP-diacylglycerol--serine O-phosphatidyltransferase
VIRIKKPKLRNPLPFVKLLPNLMTLMGLCIGLSSLRFALDSRWELAAICIVIAVVIDAIDGKLARMLSATSHFGAELDSLCDFVNFGLAPSLLMYLWLLHFPAFNVLSWAVVLFFVVCMAIRLARFNTSIVSDSSPPLKNFFVGVPAPLGALLLITPIMLDFDFSTAMNINIRTHSLLINLYQIIIACLLASRIPIFSLKHITIKPEYVWISLLLGSALIITIVMYPWYVIPALGICYICTIPISLFVAKKIN